MSRTCSPALGGGTGQFVDIGHHLCHGVTDAEQQDGMLVAVQTPTWPHLFRHGAATAMLKDSDNDAVFVRDQLGHPNIRETLQSAALSEAKRREKAARLRIAPETWPAAWR